MVNPIEQTFYDIRLYTRTPHIYPFLRIFTISKLIDNTRTIAADTQRELFFMITDKRFLHAGKGAEVGLGKYEIEGRG